MFISGVTQSLQCHLFRGTHNLVTRVHAMDVEAVIPDLLVNSRTLPVEDVANESILQESAEVAQQRERQPPHQNTSNTTFTTTDTALDEENYLSPASVAKDSSVSQERTYTMFALRSKVQPIKVQVQLNSCEITMEVDTGASLTLLNESTYSRIATNQELKPTTVKKSTYTGELLPVLGSIDVDVVYQSYCLTLPAIVVKEQVQIFSEEIGCL